MSRVAGYLTYMALRCRVAHKPPRNCQILSKLSLREVDELNSRKNNIWKPLKCQNTTANEHEVSFLVRTPICGEISCIWIRGSILLDKHGKTFPATSSKLSLASIAKERGVGLDQPLVMGARRG
jgi:hypothetical protein